MNYQIINGNNIDVLKTFPDNHFDSIVTDPPYGIDFLGKAWDANTGALETYQECLRVLKPGGHILAFSAARTYHHLAITLEQAGFEIRDQIMWIYSSGFPKSQDVGRSIQRSLGVKEKKTLTPWENSKSRISFDNAGEKLADTPPSEQVIVTDPEAKQWEGWGTALKPAHEPICLARKPIKVGSVAKNVQIHGTGALNIDANRVPYESEADAATYLDNKAGPAMRSKTANGEKSKMFENQTGFKAIKKNITAEEDLPIGRFPSNVIGEIADGYQKYFYCPKVSRRERHIGFDDLPTTSGTNNVNHTAMENLTRTMNREDKGNNHPTVKPVELMKYLIKLVTPPGGIVLDPFNGSGSTGMAAVELGHEYVGIELDPAYVEIANKRIAAWNQDDSTYKELFE